MMKILQKTPIIITIFFSIIFLLCSAQNNTEEQHMNVVMRMVGHEFLLQMGDSTSRVLPIKSIGNSYMIQFEHEMAIEPDLLSLTANKVLEENKINVGYIMEVKSCDKQEVVYSFEKNISANNDLIPCKSRPLPKDCYQFNFTILEEPKYNVVENHAEQQPNNSLIYGLIISTIIIGFGVYGYNRKKKITATNTEILAIGKYQFDKKGMKLIYKGVEDELSSKESDLLELLYINENKTLERDYILNVVWNDDGDYIGRTLDVSISKLRKKLAEDSNIKIVNIRGVGYRLVLSN